MFKKQVSKKKNQKKKPEPQQCEMLPWAPISQISYK